MSDVQQSEGLWDFACQQCPFTSTGWPSKKVASARASQHFDEHLGGIAMASLDEFRTEQGLTSEGKVS